MIMVTAVQCDEACLKFQFIDLVIMYAPTDVPTVGARLPTDAMLRFSLSRSLLTTTYDGPLRFKHNMAQIYWLCVGSNLAPFDLPARRSP